MKTTRTAHLKAKTIGKMLLLLALCIALTGCGTEKAATPSATTQPTETHETATEATASPVAVSTVETTTVSSEDPYEFVSVSSITLKVPTELAGSLAHEQVVNGKAVTETFYMKAGEQNIPLYNINVGDETLGDWLGMLKTESGDIPITYTIFTVADELLVAAGEEASDTYAELMNAFNTMLEDVMNDERFTLEKPLASGEVQMTYWTVTLPSNMSFTETVENNNYQAVFLGEIQGEKVDLYRVRIGDIVAKTELGLFTIDGVTQTVSIESCDIGEHATWTDENYSEAYRMMDTINDVISQITSSERYSTVDE